MRIKHANSIEEFKNIRDEKINHWIDTYFEKNCVTYEYINSNQIKIIDKKNDSMIINLDDID